MEYARESSLVDRIKREMRKKAAVRRRKALIASDDPVRNYANNLANSFPNNSSSNSPNNTSHIIDEIRQNHRRNQEQAKLNLNSIRNDYYVYINDDSVLNPFGLDSNVLATIKNETKDCYGSESKAKKLFDWFEENIDYGEDKRIAGYSTGQEVFRNKEGVCGEMVFLYVTMVRGLGLRANYVSIRKDNDGDKVNHACAGVDVERGFILVDPAYHKFDIKHRKYIIRTDKEIMETFKGWRGG